MSSAVLRRDPYGGGFCVARNSGHNTFGDALVGVYEKEELRETVSLLRNNL